MAERSQSDHIYDSSGKLNSTGSANAYVIEVAEQIAGYYQGMPPIRFKANFGNTGSATANIVTQTAPSGLGAVTLKKLGGATNLASGDIVSGGVYTLIHDGTNFQVLELNAPEVSDGISAGLTWNFDSATAMADPGTGDFRLNNATLSSVTAAAISDLTSETGNPDASAWVLAWDDSTNSVRGTLVIKKFGAEQNFAIYNSTGASTDNSGWTQLALTYVAHNGSFSDTDPCVFNFSRAGNVGATGAAGANGVASINIQSFTSSDTYTPTAGMAFCIIEVQGAGGGGGGADVTAGNFAAGGGGGGGEYAKGVFSAASIGASQSITINAAGTAGNNTGGNGGNGGSVSVGALIAANGGSGGTGTGNATTSEDTRAGGAGGTGGAGGDLRIPGEPGLHGTVVGGDTDPVGGRGGASRLGFGGSGGILDAAGSNGQNYGGGGGGAAEDDATGQTGGVGGPGIVIITEYIA